ncbi:MAG: hypothetical protein ABIP48_10375 [Planctomycetota bacterium]
MVVIVFDGAPGKTGIVGSCGNNVPGGAPGVAYGSHVGAGWMPP